MDHWPGQTPVAAPGGRVGLAEELEVDQKVLALGTAGRSEGGACRAEMGSAFGAHSGGQDGGVRRRAGGGRDVRQPEVSPSLAVRFRPAPLTFREMSLQ